MGIPKETIAEGDNRNHDDGEDTCASTATTSAHWRRATTHPVMRRQCVESRMRHIARQRQLEDERRWRRDKWGVASCDNQMAKKRLMQSCKAESATAAARQQGRRDNQLANNRQTGREAYKRQTGGEASAQEAMERQEDERRRPHDVRRHDNQPEAPAEPLPPPPPPPPPPPAPPLARMVAPLTRSLAMVAAATSPASSVSSASTKSALPPLSSSTPSHHCQRCRPPSDAWRTLLASVAPTAKQLLLQ